MQILLGHTQSRARSAISGVDAAAVLGLVLHRTISVRVRDLLRLARAIISGDRTALAPGRRQGTRAFAELSCGLVAMAAGLVARSDAVSFFAAALEVAMAAVVVVDAAEATDRPVGATAA